MGVGGRNVLHSQEQVILMLRYGNAISNVLVRCMYVCQHTHLYSNTWSPSRENISVISNTCTLNQNQNLCVECHCWCNRIADQVVQISADILHRFNPVKFTIIFKSFNLNIYKRLKFFIYKKYINKSFLILELPIHPE